MALGEENLSRRTCDSGELLPEEGRFVLVHGDEIGGIWDTYLDALKAGYELYGLEAFMVKRIAWAETVQKFTRNLHLCPRSSYG